MAASPKFYKPAAAFSSPCASPRPAGAGFGFGADDGCFSSSCRTPTGSRISYLKEPTTCPPAPRKPLCKKRLFQSQQQGGDSQTEVPIISLRLDELERIFRPHPKADKRRRGGPNAHPAKKEQQALVSSSLLLSTTTGSR